MNRSVKYTFVLALLAGCLTYGIYANNDRVCPEDVRSIALSKVEHRIERWGYESGLVFSDRAGEQGCDLSYIYQSESRLIHFKVVRGHKVTWWDCNERGRCDHLNKYIDNNSHDFNLDLENLFKVSE